MQWQLEDNIPPHVGCLIHLFPIQWPRYHSKNHLTLQMLTIPNATVATKHSKSLGGKKNCWRRNLLVSSVRVAWYIETMLWTLAALDWKLYSLTTTCLVFQINCFSKLFSVFAGMELGSHTTQLILYINIHNCIILFLSQMDVDFTYTKRGLQNHRIVNARPAQWELNHHSAKLPLLTCVKDCV